MKIFQLLVVLLVFSTQSAAAKTLLVLGDSLSAAYNMQPQQGWVALMAERIALQHPAVKVVNASISGETTSGGLTRLPELLDRHQPDYIVLELAANDGLRGMPLQIIKKNLKQLIGLSKQVPAQVLILGVRLPTNYGPRYTEQFFRLFAELAQQQSISIVPFFMQGIALQSALMQADGLHPNARAQPFILENVWPAVNEMLEK
ncbi:MAG: lysophospholipase L1 and related esterase [Osedax symbiont Rs1]|nr:MAG: lysophospholipase L1 and related esterase [Osedax symbiont Rs1]